MNERFSWSKVWVSLNIVFILFSQVAFFRQTQSVPRVPNDSIITAKVLEYSILSSILIFFFRAFPEARSIPKAPRKIIGFYTERLNTRR